VADGAADDGIPKEGGRAWIDYFPGRDIVFRCKAEDGGDAQWKREVLAKRI
jgi:hypothetical protein